MPGPSNRRHRRLPTNRAAEVVVKGRCIQATVKSASDGGIGVSLSVGVTDDVFRGASVRVRLPIAGGVIELPAQVAWRSQRFPNEIGLRLHLEVAGAKFRAEYATWIHELMTGAGAIAPGAIVLSA